MFESNFQVAMLIFLYRKRNFKAPSIRSFENPIYRQTTKDDNDETKLDENSDSM